MAFIMDFPPKKCSERFLKAAEQLKAKGYAFGPSKKMRQVDPDTDKIDEDQGRHFAILCRVA